MTLTILSIGTAVPATRIDQAAALGIARSLACPTPEQDTWLPAMYAGTAIRTRHLALAPSLIQDVLDGTRGSGSVFLPTGEADYRGPDTGQRMEHYAELAPPLALDACREAIRRGQLPPAAFTHLITVSCTGFFAPGIEFSLIAGLGLPATIQRTHVGFMGCHGALNGLRVARAFAESSPGAKVLLCAVELCSLHYHYSWNPGKMVANALFADGAAALVGVGEDSVQQSSPWQVAASGSFLIPGSAGAMTWTVGTHGFEMTLAKNVPALIARHLRRWLEEWLTQQDVRLDEVRSWAVHPGGPRILDAVEEALQLPAGALTVSRSIFAEYGNMSSPTVLFILHRLRDQEGAFSQGAASVRPCVALAFGPGLVVEAALLQ